MNAISRIDAVDGAAKPVYGWRAYGILGGVAAANIGVWIWAWLAFGDSPALFGMAALACSLGLRHAVDADHIAAIDNVTRHMMQKDKRPVAVGFFFSLGHSSVVILVTLGIALAAHALRARFETVKEVGSLVGTCVSALSLFIIAAANAFVLKDTYMKFRALRRGEGDARCLDNRPMRATGMGRVLRPFFNLIRQSWHMFPLGFLFGLGFDTATEISLLGISATEVSKGLPLVSIMVFPALFTCAMALIDTLDNLLMLGAYQWAFVNPLRKLHYNMTVTSVSIFVALSIGGVEAAGLAVERFGLRGMIWDFIGAMNDRLDIAGYAIIGIFALSWAASILFYRWKKYDEPAPLAMQTSISGAMRADP